MNGHTAGHAELPRTAYLDHTLRRARTAAEQRSHRYVTLEHLLLALLDDPDALKVVQAAGADLLLIKAAAADFVNNRMSALVVPDGRAPSFSYKFDSLFFGASEDAIRAGRREVDGAIVLIAVAKERESSASGILAANGFHAQAAMQLLGAAPIPPPPPGTSQQALGSVSSQLAAPPRPETALRAPPPPPLKTPDLSPANAEMEDMLLSVRNILDAEERKERGLPPAVPPPAPAMRAPQPRIEPQFRFDAGADRQSGSRPADLRPPAPQARPEPAPRPDPGPSPEGRGRQQGADRAGGFSERPAAGFDLESGAAPGPKSKKRKEGERKPARGRGETPGLLAKVLEGIPRKVRSGSAVTIQIRLTKEEAQAIFAKMGRRGQPQLGGEPQVASRAVTLRLSAPEGGFFVEASSPETQWIFDRPSFLGEEAFGTWAWTLIPGQRGAFALAVSMSARDVDGNGLAGELQVPEQWIKIRVQGSFWRSLAGVLNAALLLAAGSGLTIAAWYALKITGKLPH
jgi:hypothetical protein